NGYANVNRSNEKKPVRVQSYENDKSPYGVYDLAGNVSEWVDEFYSERYDGETFRQLRVYRGGNFHDKQVTGTYRNFDYPSLGDVPEKDERDKKDNKQEYIERLLPKVGFRCAKDAGK